MATRTRLCTQISEKKVGSISMGHTYGNWLKKKLDGQYFDVPSYAGTIEGLRWHWQAI